MMTIGVDLGGSNIRAGIQSDGKITQKRHVPLTHKDSLDDTLEQLVDNIKPLMVPGIRRIGIAVPSVVDVKNGIVYNVVNIPSWEKVELKQILEQKFSVPVYVDNDANAFVLGEQLHGKAKHHNNVVGLVMGTGIGSGLVLNGQLYRGNNTGAGEVGYFPYLDKDFEFYCSGNFFSAVHNISAFDAFQQAQSGNQHAVRIWTEFGNHLGNALKAVVYAYDPEVIVLGGSVSKAFSFFEKSMRHSLHTNFHFPESLKRLKIEKSEDENITLLGASSLLYH
jgi:glucokinase